jgi:hypothetical protein
MPAKRPGALRRSHGPGQRQRSAAGLLGEHGRTVGKDQAFKLGQGACERVGGATRGTSVAQLAHGGSALSGNVRLMRDGDGQ